MFKLFSLAPQDRGKSAKIVTISSNTVSIKSGKDSSRTLKFDSIFNNISEISRSISFDRPVTYICFCSKGAYGGDGLILSTLKEILGYYIGSVRKSNSYVNMYLVNSTTKLDVQATKNGPPPRVSVKSFRDVEPLLDKFVPKVVQPGKDSLYVTVGDKILHRFFFIPVGPVRNRIIYDRFQPDSAANKSSTNDVLCQTILQALDSAADGNIYLDTRLSNLDSFDDNAFLLQLTQSFSKFVETKIPKKARKGDSTMGSVSYSLENKFGFSKSKTSLNSSHGTSGAIQHTSKNQSNDNDYSWRKFITRKRMEDNVETEYIDKERLSHIARKAACDPNCDEGELGEILKILNKEIEDFEEFKSSITKSLKNLNKSLKACKAHENKTKKKLDEAKNTYIKLRTQNNTKKAASESITYGNYTLEDNDYKFAYECLKEEVADLENEIEFLKIAFPEVDELSPHEHDSDDSPDKVERKPVVSFALADKVGEDQMNEEESAYAELSSDDDGEIVTPVRNRIEIRPESVV